MRGGGETGSTGVTATSHNSRPPVGALFAVQGREGMPTLSVGIWGEIPGAGCLDRRRWKSSDVPNNPGRGNGLRLRGMEVRLRQGFLMAKNPQKGPRGLDLEGQTGAARLKGSMARDGGWPK